MWLFGLNQCLEMICHDPMYCNGLSATKFLKRDHSKTYGIKVFFFGKEN